MGTVLATAVAADVWERYAKIRAQRGDQRILRANLQVLLGARRLHPSKPEQSVLALRDGLDSNDTERFPESDFGPAMISGKVNMDRLTRIAAAFTMRGAAEEDPTAAASLDHHTPPSYKRKGMNDVGWNIWRGNYGAWMTQLAPDETSVGWWRVGSRAQPYGRFARGFEHASGRDVLGFVLDTHLWGGLPLESPPAPISLRVVWFSGSNDAGVNDTGRFQLKYDAETGCRTAAHIDVGNTGRWEEHTVTVHDARFGGLSSSCHALKGADLLLVNRGAMRDVIFHMIEATRIIDPVSWLV